VAQPTKTKTYRMNNKRRDEVTVEVPVRGEDPATLGCLRGDRARQFSVGGAYPLVLRSRKPWDYNDSS